jgi:hypothetical protein
MSMKSFEIALPTKPSDAPTLPSLEDGYESYRKLEAEILAVPEVEVLRVQVDVTRACAIALGAVKAIHSMKPLVAGKLPAHDVHAIDNIADYIFAAYYAHAISAPPARDVEKLQKLAEEAAPLREDLLVQAEALAHKGYFDGGKVAEIRGGTGYLDMATDLTSLSLLFRSGWTIVKDKTTVSQEEAERADVLGRELLAAVGARLQPNGEATSLDIAMDRRARAFTVFQRAYERCRQAAAYLRWDEGDAEALVPSLFTRGRSRKPVVNEPGEDLVVTTPAAPTQPGGGSGSADPASPPTA